MHFFSPLSILIRLYNAGDVAAAERAPDQGGGAGGAAGAVAAGYDAGADVLVDAHDTLALLLQLLLLPLQLLQLLGEARLLQAIRVRSYQSSNMRSVRTFAELMTLTLMWQ